MTVKKNQWQIGLNENAGLELSDNSQGFCMTGGLTTLRSSNRAELKPLTIQNVSEKEGMLRYELVYPGDIHIKHEIGCTEDNDWLKIETSIFNGSDSSLPIESVGLFSCSVLTSPFDRVFVTDISMTGVNGIFPIKQSHKSYYCTGLTDHYGNHACVLGFEQLDAAFYHFQVSHLGDNSSIEAVCSREGVLLKSGQELNISPLLIGSSSSLSELMQKYGRHVGKVMGARHFDKVKTGWCSWYHYYGRETQEDILSNVKALAESPLKKDIQVIQIDDGWNLPDNQHPRVWGDWYPGSKFSYNMKNIADKIHEYGFEAGLWLAPFSVCKDSNLYKEHKDWLVKSENQSGLLEPAGSGGISGLDLTHPEVLQFLHETFDRVFNQWGFDYIKIDFLIHGVMAGKHYDTTKTTAEAFRQAMEVIRNVAGERFILNCGSPIGPAIGLCDGMRIGYDVGGRWYAPINIKNWPNGNCNIKSAAYPTIFRQWMHGHWWQNDPDCLVVRDGPVSYEVECMNKGNAESPVPESDFGLSDEEAGFWVRLVWMTGGMGLLSEVWSELSPDRQQLLMKAFPPNKDYAVWVDWYTDHEVGILKTMNDILRIGIFNMGDERKTICLSSEKLNVKQWHFSERINNDSFSGTGDMIEFPEIPPHSGRVWEMVEV